MTTGSTTETSGFDFLVETREFSVLPVLPERLWGPPSLLSDRFGGCFHKAKRPRHETERSAPPSEGDIRNAWNCTVFALCTAMTCAAIALNFAAASIITCALFSN